MLTGCDYSRLQQFEALEKNVSKPLNKYPFDPMTTKTATVGKTGYVTVDYRYYSIPSLVRLGLGKIGKYANKTEQYKREMLREN